MPPSCAAIECEIPVDDVDEYPPAHLIFPAGDRPPPKTVAVRTVFELASADAGLRLLEGFRHERPAAGARSVMCLRIEGVTRHVGAAYPVRWTPEDDEREKQRRARQKPPRPSKKARSRSKKLLDLIGVHPDT